MNAASAASQRLVDGLASCGLLAAPADEPARLKIREQARRLFLFILLSVLLEQRSGGDPFDRLVAERLKARFSGELLASRKALKSISRKALPRSDADELGAKLEAAGKLDPFAPYYGSFDAMRKDPAQGPFAVLARRLAEEQFESASRSAAYEKIFSLAAALSDELVSGL